MTENDKIGAVDFLLDELSQIDKRLADLFTERARVASYLTRLTGSAPPPYDEGASHSLARPRSNLEPVAGGGARAVAFQDTPATQSGTERVYRSRQFNKRLVEEAVEIILASGRPMSTPEIMKTHSMREEASSEALYRLMYNRVVTGSLMSLDGAFWPEGRPLPDGWRLEKARRSAKLSQK